MECLDNVWTVVHSACGPDLYGGTSGIALFLSELFSWTGEGVFRITARGAITQALSCVEGLNKQNRIGFYTGTTGIGWALAKIGENLRDELLIERGLEVLESPTLQEPVDQPNDVLNGCAGVIGPLLQVHSCYPRDSLLDFALCSGKRLLAWVRTDRNPSTDLTGFSHGIAGIAWALLELYDRTGERCFRETAEEAFQYENLWFDREHENWQDLRTRDRKRGDLASSSYMNTWCHGAPGIALSRLRAYEITRDDRWKHEAEVALRTTARSVEEFQRTATGNFCLCHGITGNAESLALANTILPTFSYLSLIEAVGMKGIEVFDKCDVAWPCGVPGGGENPSLMLGLAGIGHFYLRLYGRDRTDSVLIVNRTRR